ncbi:MAG: SRPBCC family protein [Aeromicrobium sp.]
MAVNRRLVNATPHDVWQVLADGWLYALWVVGAARMRDVDDSWPEKGSRIHHSVGLWPLLINDHTEVLDVVPGESISLRAKAWPAGEAHVDIGLKETGARTEVVMEEFPVAGPGKLIPPPVQGLSLKWRNHEALRRLAFIAEQRHETRARP